MAGIWVPQHLSSTAWGRSVLFQHWTLDLTRPLLILISDFYISSCFFHMVFSSCSLGHLWRTSWYTVRSSGATLFHPSFMALYREWRFLMQWSLVIILFLSFLWDHHWDWMVFNCSLHFYSSFRFYWSYFWLPFFQVYNGLHSRHFILILVFVQQFSNKRVICSISFSISTCFSTLCVSPHLYVKPQFSSDNLI